MHASPASQTLHDDAVATTVDASADASSAPSGAPSGAISGATPGAALFRSEGFAEDLDSSRPQAWHPPRARFAWRRWRWWLYALLALAASLGLAIAIGHHPQP